MSLKNKVMILVFTLASLVTGVAFAEAPETIMGAQTVNAEKAKALHKAGAVFVDVRNERDWLLGHVAGAVNLDFSEDEFVVLYLSQAIDKSIPIVFYCDSPLATSSATASFFAVSWGYENVYYFRDGYFSWVAADYPVEFNIAAR